MILLKFGIFEIDLPLIFSFLFGLAVGLALFSLIYLVIVLSTINKKKYIVSAAKNNVSDEEILQMIEESKVMFNDKYLKGEESHIIHCRNICSSLVNNIAIKFFPKSKYPLYELSIDELLMLSVYISNRLDDILDTRGLRMLRKFKVSTIVSLGDVKKSIEENVIVKATKKYKIAETLKAAKSVLNVVNPVYWVRKAIVKNATDIVIKKLCIIIISICGEETYKIYSKNVFNEDKEIDSHVENLVYEMKQEISDMDQKEE